jgi:hypothetical protein
MIPLHVLHAACADASNYVVQRPRQVFNIFKFSPDSNRDLAVTK